jgi:hypothetical protein
MELAADNGIVHGGRRAVTVQIAAFVPFQSSTGGGLAAGATGC